MSLNFCKSRFSWQSEQVLNFRISVYATRSTTLSSLLANCPQEIMLPPYPLSLDFQLRVWDQSLSFNFGHPTHPVSGLRNEKNFLSSFIFNGFFKTSVRLPRLRTSFAEWSWIISDVAFNFLFLIKINLTTNFWSKRQMKSWYSTEKAFSPIGCGINDTSCRFMMIRCLLDNCLTTTRQLPDVNMTISIWFLDSCLITSWQLLMTDILLSKHAWQPEDYFTTSKLILDNSR